MSGADGAGEQGIIERLDRWDERGPYAVRVDTGDVDGYAAAEVAQYAHSILVDMGKQDVGVDVAERYDASTDRGHDFPPALQSDAVTLSRVYLGHVDDWYARELVDRFGDDELFDRVDVEPNMGPLGPEGAS